MKQFDVHRNPGRFRNELPYVVIVQALLLTGHRRRVVIPLERTTLSDSGGGHRVPHFQVLGEAFICDPMLIQSITASTLGPAIANLETEGDRIIRAIDEVINRV